MNKEFNELQKENDRLREGINNIFHDLKLKETAEDLWALINSLVENEIKQEELCE